MDRTPSAPNYFGLTLGLGRGHCPKIRKLCCILNILSAAQHEAACTGFFAGCHIRQTIENLSGPKNTKNVTFCRSMTEHVK